MSGPFTYLACPYAHDDPAICEARFRAANLAAATLIAQGELVISPLSHACPIAEARDLPRGWDYWGRFDRALLECCCRVIVLKIDGWQESVGVRGELEYARSLGLPVDYMEPIL